MSDHKPIPAYQGNAISLLNTLSNCMIELRDAGLMKLSWKTISDSLTLDNCDALTNNSHLTDGTKYDLRRLLLISIGATNDQEERYEQFRHIASYIDRRAIATEFLH